MTLKVFGETVRVLSWQEACLKFDGDLVSALIGATSGALVAGAVYLGQLRQSKLSLILGMMTDFNSVEMMSARTDAFETLKAHPDLNLAATDDAETAAVPQSDKDQVWRVMVFYERIWATLAYGKVAPTVVANLFGEVFVWWWEFSFKYTQHYPAHETTCRHLAELFAWLEDHMKATGRASEFTNWIVKGQERRAAIGRPIVGSRL